MVAVVSVTVPESARVVVPVAVTEVEDTDGTVVPVVSLAGAGTMISPTSRRIMVMIPVHNRECIRVR
jgi:hypothetical protein